MASEGTSSSTDKERMDATLTAGNMIAQGKRNMVCGEVPTAVNQFQEASSILAKAYGETAKECAEAYFCYGQALLDLARMETGVLGNALQGVPDEEEQDQDDKEEKSSDDQFEKTDNVDGEERIKLRQEVVDAMSLEEVEQKKKAEDSEKSKEGGEKAENGENKKTEEGEAMEVEAGEEKDKGDKTDSSQTEDKVSSEKGEKTDEDKKEVTEKTETCEAAEKVEGTEKEKSKDGEEKDVADKSKDGEEKDVADKSKDGEEKDVADKSKGDQKEGEDDKKEEKMEEGETKEEKSDKADVKDEEMKDKEESAESSTKEENSAEEGEEDGEEEEEGEEEEGEETAEGEQSAEDGEKSQDEESGSKEGENADDVPNLQLAWEMLELAKLIYLKDETKEAKLKAAETHLKLGEVSLETENYEQAVEDFGTCLKIQKEHLEADDRLLAETHYQLGLAHAFNKNYDESADQYRAAVKVMEDKIGKLTEIVENKSTEKGKEPAGFDDPVTAAQKEIKELKEILPDIIAKIEDTAEEKKNLEELKNLAKEAAGTQFLSSTTDAEKPLEGQTETKAADISHLIRRKRKPEEEAAEDANESKKTRQEDGSGDATTQPNGVNGVKDSPEKMEADTTKKPEPAISEEAPAATA